MVVFTPVYIMLTASVNKTPRSDIFNVFPSETWARRLCVALGPGPVRLTDRTDAMVTPRLSAPGRCRSRRHRRPLKCRGGVARRRKVDLRIGFQRWQSRSALLPDGRTAKWTCDDETACCVCLIAVCGRLLWWSPLQIARRSMTEQPLTCPLTDPPESPTARRPATVTYFSSRHSFDSDAPD